MKKKEIALMLYKTNKIENQKKLKKIATVYALQIPKIKKENSKL